MNLIKTLQSLIFPQRISWVGRDHCTHCGGSHVVVEIIGGPCDGALVKILDEEQIVWDGELTAEEGSFDFSQKGNDEGIH